MDFIVLTVSLTSSIGMSTLLLYCYYGKLATDSYEKTPSLVFEMDWYKQSYKVQQYLILMIANMQKPIYYHGFEVVKLDLETFVTVIGPIFSRFQMN